MATHPVGHDRDVAPVRLRARSAVAFVVCTILGGCAGCSASDESGTRFLDYDGMVQEFLQTQEDLVYPPGHAKEPPPPQGDSGQFQEGWGESMATQEWNCSWGNRWVETAGVDPDGSSEAFSMYEQLLRTRTFERSFDAELQAFIRDTIDKARLGDTAPLRDDIEANC